MDNNQVNYGKEVLRAIYTIAQHHGLQNIEISEHAARILVDATGRATFALAKAADPKVSAVLVHATKCGSVIVSVRRDKNDYHEVVISE